MPVNIPLSGNNWTLFLDRDGVLNKKLEGDYVKTPAELEVLPGTKTALTRFRNSFIRIVVVTNQSGIVKGLMTEQDFEIVTEALHQQIGWVDAVYHCPHRPEDGCICRKPKTGMAEAAKIQFPEIDFSCSVLIGDSVTDMQLGKTLGMLCIQIGGGFKFKEADFIAHSLSEIHFT